MTPEERDFIPENLAAQLRETAGFIVLRILAQHWISKAKERLVCTDSEVESAKIRGEIRSLKHFRDLEQRVETILSATKQKG